jgi:hypothetical protein
MVDVRLFCTAEDFTFIIQGSHQARACVAHLRLTSVLNRLCGYAAAVRLIAQPEETTPCRN